MTKLEEDVYTAMRSIPAEGDGFLSEEVLAKAAAEVAKRYIDKAFNAGLARTYLHQGQRKSKETWLKENGITE